MKASEWKRKVFRGCGFGFGTNKYSVHNKYDQINLFDNKIYATLMGTIGRKCINTHASELNSLSLSLHSLVKYLFHSKIEMSRD